jgi:hypothetical protein
VLRYGRTLVAGQLIEWLGSELTGGPFSSSAGYSSGLIADGAPLRRTVGPIRFRVQAADCGEISGAVEGLGFDVSWLGPGAGLGPGTPTLGAATDLTVLSERATFTITGPSPGP